MLLQDWLQRVAYPRLVIDEQNPGRHLNTPAVLDDLLPFHVGQKAKAIAAALAWFPVSFWRFCKRTKGPSLKRWAFIDNHLQTFYSWFLNE
jgi:hypothetical protein